MSVEQEPTFPREAADISARPLAALPALGLLAVACAFAAFFVQRAERRTAARADERRPIQYAPRPPGPELQADPRGSLAALREREDQALDGWSWADRRAGLARVPIERAMEELAAEGLPHR